MTGDVGRSVDRAGAIDDECGCGSDPVLRQILIAAILAMTSATARSRGYLPISCARTASTSRKPDLSGVVIGLGGALGSWLGGLVSDRLRERDVRWSLWLVALVFVVARPFAMAFYGVADTSLALALFVLPAAVGRLYRPCVAVLHERIERASAAAGLGVVPDRADAGGPGAWAVAVGAMSDMVFAQYGTDSLRYALLAWQFIGFWAAIHFYLGGAALREGEGATTAAAEA